MKFTSAFAVLFILTSSQLSYGSGAELCSRFASPDHRFFLIGDAYKASDLAVIGEITYTPKPILKIKTIIKGTETKKKIELNTTHCQGTACSGGFSVAPKVDLFFLLKSKNGIYDSVTENGNFSCPVVYEVEKEYVKFNEKNIPIKDLKNYLEKKPENIPIF